MSKTSNEKSGLGVEEVLATLAVFLLAGLFLWSQLSNRGEVVTSTGPVPEPAALPPPETAERAPSTPMRHEGGMRAAMETAPQREERPSSPSLADTGRSVPLTFSCGPRTDDDRGRGTKGSALDCGIGNFELTPEERARGVAVGAADEEILGAEIEIVPSSYSREVPTRSSSAVPDLADEQLLDDDGIGEPVITSVNVDPTTGTVQLKGIAPAGVSRLQLVVNGKRLSPLTVTSGIWKTRLGPAGDVLHIQVLGLDDAGEITVDPRSTLSAYVVSLRRSDGDADISVIPGELYRAEALSELYAHARSAGADMPLMNRINGFGNRPFRAGEVVFVPYTVVE